MIDQVPMTLINHPTNRVTDQVIGSAVEVHRALGPGLLESSYQSCLSEELGIRRVPHTLSVELPLRYKGRELHKAYVIDMLVADLVIVEIKAVERIHPVHEAQLLTYLRLSGKTAGLLLNFNVRLMRDGIRRLLY